MRVEPAQNKQRCVQRAELINDGYHSDSTVTTNIKKTETNLKCEQTETQTAVLVLISDV